jgi:hypothetical protein
LILASYLGCYGAALMMVLPESKHWAPLLLPLHALSASGVWLAFKTLSALRHHGEFTATCLRLRASVVGLAAVITCWCLIGAMAWALAHAQRRRFIESVTTLAESAPELPLSLAERKLYTAVSSARSADAVGYLFKVKGAPRPANLYSAHVREGAALGVSSSYYYTRHELPPHTTSFYFVSVVAGQSIGDSRPYTLHVRARGRAEIVSVKLLDLSQWRIGLPLSLLFREEDEGPAAGLLQDNLEVTGGFGSLTELEVATGLRIELAGSEPAGSR